MDRAPNSNGERSPASDSDGFPTGSRESTVEVDPDAVRSKEGTSHERIHGSATKQPLGPDEVYCWSCGVPVKSAAEVCPTCGVRQHSPPSNGEKNPGLAALASAFIVGLGQILNGKVGKGIGLMALMFVATISVVGWIVLPLIWGYAVYDAYRTAKNIDQQGHTTMHNP